MTSAVTAMPRAFAQRTTSTLPAVDTWQTCRRAPTASASSTSRAMIASSATDGPAGESEFGGQRPFVHLGAFGEPRLLGVLGDDAVERRDVFERPTHEQGVVHALAVVAEHPHGGARAGHRADLGEVLPRESDRHGTDGAHRHVAVLVAERGDLFDDSRGVGDRDSCSPSRARP